MIETGAITGAPWRLMLDREMGFAADPFPIEWRGRIGVFYERMNYRADRGEIWFQPFDERGPAGEPVPAIREPWHLSYPFLIEEDGELYLIPEASVSRAVILYRCVAFPDRWEPVARILDDVEAADATVFKHDGRYWMTSVVRNGVGGYSGHARHSSRAQSLRPMGAARPQSCRRRRPLFTPGWRRREDSDRLVSARAGLLSRLWHGDGDHADRPS